MSDPHLLVVGSSPDLTEGLETDPSSSIFVEVSKSVSDALRKISEQSYDAVLCWMEAQDDLYGIIRIRKARPQLPIVAATRGEDPGFVEWARRLGATRAYRQTSDLSTALGLVVQALQSGELALELLAQSQEAQQRALEVKQLAKTTRLLIRDARNEQRKSSRLQFLPLVVEDDPNEAFLMLRAMDKADIFAPLPIMKSAEEAIDYVAGAGPYSDRAEYPLPSIVLLDLKLPRKSGFAVLDYIRSRPELRRLKVVILSASTLPEDINRAYESKADAFFTKPTSFRAFVELIGSLERHLSTPRVDLEA
jgi:CheY-like chemotaxis protein